MFSATEFLRDCCWVGLVERLDVEDETRLDPIDPHLLAASEREPFRYLRPPELAADEDLAVASELADLTDDRLWAHGNRGPSHRDRLRDREGPGRAEHGGDRDNQPDVLVVGRGRVSEQHQRPDHE